MTTKELLDEFNERLEQDVFMFFNPNNPIEDDAWSLQAENRRYLYKVVNKTIEELEWRAKKNLPSFIEEIIKELEASIRKEVVEEVIARVKDYKNYYNPIGDEVNQERHRTAENIIKMIKGITLN